MRRRFSRLALVATGVAGVLILSLAALYVARNLIVRDALLSWLQKRGVVADAEITHFGVSSATARVVLGPKAQPAFSVESAEIRYAVSAPWSAEGLGVQVSSVQLTRPVLRAQLHEGALTFGALDPIVAEFRRRPAGTQPAIRAKAAHIILTTDYGPANLTGDAALADGKLLRLDARLSPTRFTRGDQSAQVRSGVAKLRTRAERIDLDLDLQLDRLAVRSDRGDAMHFRLTGDLPYPDLKRVAADGPVNLRLTALVGEAVLNNARLGPGRVAASFQGRATGPLAALTLDGVGEAVADGDALEFGGLRTRAVTFKAQATRVKWTRTDGRLAAVLVGNATAKSLTQANLRLSHVATSFTGPFTTGLQGLDAALRIALTAQGEVTGVPQPLSEDVVQVAATKRLLRSFHLDAPAITASLESGGLSLNLDRPLRLVGLDGASAVITATPGRPIFRNGRGDFLAEMSGGGLPHTTATVNGYRIGGSGLVAPLRLQIATDFNPARDVKVTAVGELRASGGAASFLLNGCAPVSAARLEFGENSVEAVRAQLCPLAEPVFTYRDGAWRVKARARDGEARLDLLQTQANQAGGVVEFGQLHGALYATAEVEGVDLHDIAPALRFQPLRATGPALLRDGVWEAEFKGADREGNDLGEALLSHDTRSGVGELNFDTGVLRFSEGGLQPQALSPLAAPLGAPVTGAAGFIGAITWSPGVVASRGTLTIPQLDFASPAGQVSGLSGEIQFTSLAPPTAPLEQRMRIAEVAAFAPLRDVKATVGVGADRLQIRDAEAETGGGRLRIGELDFPFAPGAPWGGVLLIEGVQVKEMVEKSPFGDHMELTAKVSGTAPFQVVDQSLRISKGELHAIEPGRLSIRREALTGVNAATGEAATPAPAAPENAFSDFAYQAMENLAFQTLSAEIDSLPGGRLGVLFRIKGENQPPKHQELRVGVVDLLNRKFLEKPQLLPSGTKVDLTLDTSLNLDQLLRDVAGYRQSRGSAGVQGQVATTPPGSLERPK